MTWSIFSVVSWSSFLFRCHFRTPECTTFRPLCEEHTDRHTNRNPESCCQHSKSGQMPRNRSWVSLLSKRGRGRSWSLQPLISGRGRRKSSSGLPAASAPQACTSHPCPDCCPTQPLRTCLRRGFPWKLQRNPPSQGLAPTSRPPPPLPPPPPPPHASTPSRLHP